MTKLPPMRSAGVTAWHGLVSVTRRGLRRYVGLGRIGLQVLVAGAELGIGLLDAAEAAQETGPPRPPAAAAGTGVTAAGGKHARPTGDGALGRTDRIVRHSSSRGAAAQPSVAAVSAPAPPMRVADGHAAPRPPLSTAPAPSARVSQEPTLVAAVADVGAEDGAGAEIRIDEPWQGYRSLRAPEVIDRLVVASDSELAVIELYERAHRSRSSVIRAVEQEHARRSHEPAHTRNGTQMTAPRPPLSNP